MNYFFLWVREVIIIFFNWPESSENYFLVVGEGEVRDNSLPWFYVIVLTVLSSMESHCLLFGGIVPTLHFVWTFWQYRNLCGFWFGRQNRVTCCQWNFDLCESICTFVIKQDWNIWLQWLKYHHHHHHHVITTPIKVQVVSFSDLLNYQTVCTDYEALRFWLLMTIVWPE